MSTTFDMNQLNANGFEELNEDWMQVVNGGSIWGAIWDGINIVVGVVAVYVGGIMVVAGAMTGNPLAAASGAFNIIAGINMIISGWPN